ncbi:helix-turn-helix domain-containing protein [Paracoccus sp. (in: a-proteobacteria)]|uniref:helix-turn-helix domain-containing protein n=1 Tax=Paracoccus sp. TaxID=267 RepID=UPI0026DF14AC|nr:helix-turn-helix transcriptional regulator [Paracoccus sp. (in: a-proteobacteria)]MDO5648698.1 helix-turn-helix transcriptional regulator [Paracoccus sp. (in: a-proteobacteria)]
MNTYIPALTTAHDLQTVIRDNARARRVALGLRQQDLAERAGVSLGSVRRFEQTGEISLSALLALAEVLDALPPFLDLFPAPVAQSLDDLTPPDAPLRPRVRRGA